MDYLCVCLFYFSFVCWSILLLFLLFCSVRRAATLINLAGTKKRKNLYCIPDNMKFCNHLAKSTAMRSLVGLRGWDYCVIWKLSEDERFIELMGCCCAGSDQSIEEDGEVDHHFPLLPCRDVMFQHPASKSCELLAQLPSSMALDSRIHGQSLISNQTKWLNFATSNVQETIGTRVLIPIHGGLIELFVTKQVPQDQRVIDFITTQCNNISLEKEQQEAFFSNSSNNMDTCFSTTDNANNNLMIMNSNDQLQASRNGDLPYDITMDRIHLSSPSMNSLHQFNYSPVTKTSTKISNNGDQMQYVDATEEANNDLPIKHEMTTKQQQSDSVLDNYCINQNDDEDENSENRLMAEQERRKKLNDRLLTLRSLVPIISKLDRTSILVDAIEYVKELQKKVKELQDELFMPDILSQNGVPSTGTNNKSEYDDHHRHKSPHGFYGTAGISKQNNNQDSESSVDRAQQMEVQVEGSQIDGNEFFVQVFGEHKPGGFVKLMEALNSLGLEVTNVYVTSCRGLVSNMFRVEKKDSEMVQVDILRKSLIELTGNASTHQEDCGTLTSWQQKEVSEGSMNYPHHHHQQHYSHIRN